MIQRPISPPGLLPTLTPRLSRTPSSRARPYRRGCGGGVAVCFVGALCAVIFMVEMRSSKMAVKPVGSASSGVPVVRVAPTEEPLVATIEQVKEEQSPPLTPPGGLWRFGSFGEYVEVSRAQGGGERMPVVERGGVDVTVPSLIIVGARRAGTSSLFSMLGQHPDVARLVPEALGENSETFVTQDPASYPREAEWPGDRLESEMPAGMLGSLLSMYARPFTMSEARTESASSHEVLTAEVNPRYLSSPLAAYRMKMSMPDVKIVVVLRDPVDRYFSELREKLCVENEDDIDWDDITLSFAKPLASRDYLSSSVLDYSPYDKRCLGEGASAADLWACQQSARKSHRPLIEGLYAGQVGRWLRAFDESQIKVVDSNALFAAPEKIAADVAKFAGLSDHTFFEFAVDRKASCDPRRRSQVIASGFSKRKEAEPQIRKWYADHNDMLSEMLGKDFGWNDRIRSMNVNGAGL